MKVPFVGQAYTMPSVDVDAQNCINWFPVMDQTGKFPEVLFPDPGHAIFSESLPGQKSVRALFELNDTLYSVVDNKFSTVDINGNRRLRGTLNTSIRPVKIIANQNQIFIADGFHGYVYQLVKTDAHDEGDFFEITRTSSTISEATFTGGGLDDMTTGGTYTGTSDKNYRVEIQTAGTPDKFRWSDTDGATWNAENIDIVLTPITLNEGVQITFTNTTGHTATNYWKFQAVTDDTFYPPLIPTQQDGYGIFPRQATNQWFITGIQDFSDINALDFTFASATPDNLVASVSIREEVWLFCRDSIEIWYNTGAATFPFQRRQNLLLGFGCVAPYSLAVADNNILLWLGRNENGQRCMLMSRGYSPQVISTEPINYEIAEYERVDDCIAFSYFWQGHLFCAFIFPTADKTWIYDLTTKMWHERLDRYTTGEPAEQEWKFGRWRANSFAFFKGKLLIGDFESGNIYQLTDSTYTDNGRMIVCERTNQHLHNELDRTFCERLQIDFQAGVGLFAGQGSDPQAMLAISKDGGHTYNGEIWKSMGKIGEYKARAKWNRLGRARNWTFKLRVTDPVYRVLLGAVGEFETSQE